MLSSALLSTKHISFRLCHGYVDGALDSGNDGGHWDLVEVVYIAPISIFSYCKSDGDRLDVGRLHGMRL